MATEIRRVLVANRGEIASRVMRTARAMGIQTVAVHSDPDAGALFVQEAQFSVAIGGRTSAESYLDAGKILAAARRSGADAIHPGYGFLSENPQFAQAVTDAGLAWIGPTPESMRAMALKVEAKRLVALAGVPLVPGAELAADAAPEEIASAAAGVGFPLLVKASAGGGGKGMRLVRDPSDLLEEVSAARSEAASAFGDPTVFLERYLERSRHVEVQVFGDQHGNVVHLFERECSIQRRHQKVVEESPSPGATPVTLTAMYEAAVAAAKTISYEGAGTVEFIVDGEDAAQVFYFLEMNTRLQVEHPVTEETTGLDLVEWQIRVARGEELPLTQREITRSGHAIEVRLYAEDPANGYLPNTGRIEWFDDSFCGVRVDTGVRTGSEVSPFYDPMLAKVICAESTREAAAKHLAEYLELFEIVGVRTNKESLAEILRSRAFRDGDTTTAFLDENPEVLVPAQPIGEVAEALTFGALGLTHAAALGAPWAGLSPTGWRNVPAVPEVWRFGVPASGGEELEVEVHLMRDRTGAWAEVHGLTGAGHPDSSPAAAAIEEKAVPAVFPDAAIRMRVERDTFVSPYSIRARLDGMGSEHATQVVGEYLMLTSPTRSFTVRVLPRHPDTAALASDHGLATPVPGTVTQVLLAPGAQVAVGDTIVVLEAMKMEHRIRANLEGTVTEIRVQVGDSVEAHHIVAVVE